MRSFKRVAGPGVIGLVFLLGYLLGALQGCAREAGELREADLVSPYAGLERREIKTLSEEDIRELEHGEGWGLALAAELNGVPGPLHLLEVSEQGAVRFSEGQLDEIRRLRAEMKERAIPLGLRLIEQERELNLRFADGDLSERELEELLAGIAETTAELRYAHLVTHLKAARVLTPQQIVHYNQVRGYASGDPHGAGHEGHHPHHPIH